MGPTLYSESTVYMTTRSGTSYKRMEGQSHHRPPTEGPTRDEGTPAEGPTNTGNALPELNSLMEILHIMLEDRERHEREIEP